MRRKIIKQGHNTLTITLPSFWVKQFNLKAGNEININERDNGLFLNTEKNNEIKKISLNLENMDIPTIWKFFMGIYREGYDEVKIKFDPDMKLENPYKFFAQHKLDMKYGKETEKKTVLEFLHELTNRFIGYEVVDYTENSIVIKEMTIPTSKEFDTSLRRVFLLIQQMSNETCEALKTGNVKMLNHIHDIDINLDKFHDYCIRILNKKGNKDPNKSSLLFSTLYLLELVGDEFKNISHHLLYDFKVKNFKNVKKIAESINEQLLLFYDLFYKFNRENAIHGSKIDIERYFNALKVYSKTQNEEEKEIFHHLRIVARYLNALVELRIQMEF